MEYIVSAQLKNWGSYIKRIEAESAEAAIEEYKSIATKFEITSPVRAMTREQRLARFKEIESWQDND